MEQLTLNGFEYSVKPGEFEIQPHLEYNNLQIYPKVGELERIIGLLNDLTENKTDSTLAVYGWSHGGFVPIGCSKVYSKVFVYSNDNVINTPNLPNNVHFNIWTRQPFAVFINDDRAINVSDFSNSYILCNKTLQIDSKEFIKITLTRSDLILYVPFDLFADFNSKFWYYFDEAGNFNYDNLIHLCIMVKNAGPMFEQVLTENLPFIDRWTVLDTGSTDGTQDLVRRVLAKKKGQLFEEPFINFRDSRNRCLDLAGKHCKYLLMLDDTYAMRGDLRKFLTVVRGDQFASSYSLLILSDDVEYYSNRVTMSQRGLRYIYTIHEVITDVDNKTNVVIPKEAAHIHDHRAPYMEKRTMDRKQYDLKLLHDMVRDDPTNPRHYYYLAQTYNLLEDYEKAAYWFKRRATTELKGHDQEAVDSWFEYARILNFKLNRPWEECKEAYESSFKRDPTRPDALYFIGIHYYLDGNRKLAYDYFKQAFALGYPIHAQFSLKPTLSFHFLPKFLTQLCYEFGDWQLGLEAAKRFLANNNNTSDSYDIIVSWYGIFNQLCKIPAGVYTIPAKPQKPVVIFVADGNWSSWTGKDILTKGLGGSETYIVEIARWIQASGKYNCIVFCKCDAPDTWEGVRYLPLERLAEFVVKNSVHTAVVSRFSEYVPLVLQGFVDNVYLLLHDLGPTGNIIPINDKLRKVICLTKWHEQYFLENFPQFKGKTDAFYYGIDSDRFKPGAKVRNSFIYSSFPNRGLLPLLQMWPVIKAKIPDATLNVYADINGKWVNDVAKEQMDEIRRILAGGLGGVTVHGWVSKSELATAWSRADIWFYPCIFKETFCLTALEAAATKTLAISTPLAALNETVGDRGILVPGNPMDREWQTQALRELFSVLADSSRKTRLVESNYRWATETTWRSRGDDFITRYLGEPPVIPMAGISKNVNYAGMENWVHDLPAGGGHKQKFLEALAVANPKRILEIGTFAGTSLIEMLNLYPAAMGVAIDAWKNYDEDGIYIIKNMEENNVEQVFYDNVRKSGLSGRVVGLKGDSCDRLLELVRKGEQFDFIYVDGSHRCLDCYSDMIIAWSLVKKGGVLAVDDILFHSEKVQAGALLDYPLKAKEHFMGKYAGQYKVISDSYRLFIQKL